MNDAGSADVSSAQRAQHAQFFEERSNRLPGTKPCILFSLYRLIFALRASALPADPDAYFSLKIKDQEVLRLTPLLLTKCNGVNETETCTRPLDSAIANQRQRVLCHSLFCARPQDCRIHR